ncbi:MAG: thioredoxin, partial [uncultured bacterium]
MDELILTQDNFDELVLEAKLPVVVDFWAPWCVPCKIQNPILEEFA